MGKTRKEKIALGGISRDEKSYLVDIDGSLAVRMYERKGVAEIR
jgi:hypothetical protein